MITEDMMHRATAAAEKRDYSKPDYDQLRDILAAAIDGTDAPEIEVTDGMIKAGISAYKFAMWRRLSYAATIEEIITHVYRAMAKASK